MDEQEVVQTQEDSAPELSPVEQEALDHGWKPEEDFKADPANENKKWRSAESFMELKPFFDKIEASNRKVKELEKGVRALAEHNSKIEETSYKRALEALRKEKRDALEEGDLVKADALGERIDEIKEQARTTPKVEEPSNPAFDAWVEENQWYNQDTKMKALADGLALQMMEDGVKDPQKIFAAVEREVRETFPNKFRNPRKDTAPSLDVSDRKAPTKDNFKLTVDEERILNTFIKAGAPISKEDYIKQIKESRGVK